MGSLTGRPRIMRSYGPFLASQAKDGSETKLQPSACGASRRSSAALKTTLGDAHAEGHHRSRRCRCSGT